MVIFSQQPLPSPSTDDFRTQRLMLVHSFAQAGSLYSFKLPLKIVGAESWIVYWKTGLDWAHKLRKIATNVLTSQP